MTFAQRKLLAVTAPWVVMDVIDAAVEKRWTAWKLEGARLEAVRASRMRKFTTLVSPPSCGDSGVSETRGSSASPVHYCLGGGVGRFFNNSGYT